MAMEGFYPSIREEDMMNHRQQNTQRRIMSPQEKASRDALLAKREKLREKQARERGQAEEGERKPRPKRKAKKERFVLEKFHIWFTFLSLIIVLMSLNLLTFVQGIQVKDNENTSAVDIITWAREDIFSFNGLYLWYKINHTEVEYPVSIVDAKVTFQNPWTLTLRVTEKEIIAGIVLSDNYAYFDQDGVVQLLTTQIQEEVPIIDEIFVAEAVLYEVLPVTDVIGFKNLLEVLQLITKYDLEVAEVIPASNSSISIVIGETTIRLGDGNFETKVPHIMPILEQLEDKNGTLFLESFDGDRGTITFK